MKNNMLSLKKFLCVFLLLILLLLLYFKFNNNLLEGALNSQTEQEKVINTSELTSTKRQQTVTERLNFIEKHKRVCNNHFSIKILDLLGDSFPDFRQFSLLAEEYIAANAINMRPSDVINIIDLVESLGMEWILSDSILQVIVSNVSENCLMDQGVINKITAKFDSEITKTCVSNGVFNNGNIRDCYKLDEYVDFSLRSSQSFGLTCAVEDATSRFVTAKGEGYLSGVDFASSLEKLLAKHDISQFRTFIVELGRMDKMIYFVERRGSIAA